MDYVPIGKRTRNQKALVMKENNRQATKARRAAKKKWQEERKKKMCEESSGFLESDDDGLKEIDKPEFEKNPKSRLCEEPSSKTLDDGDHGKAEGNSHQMGGEEKGKEIVVNNSEFENSNNSSDESLQIVGASWNPFDLYDDVGDDDDDDDSNGPGSLALRLFGLGPEGEKLVCADPSSRVENNVGGALVRVESESESQSESSNASSSSSAELDASDDDSGSDYVDVDVDDDDFGVCCDHGGNGEKGHGKITRKRRGFEGEKRNFDGLVLYAYPELGDNEMRKRTRSHFNVPKRKTKDGTFRRPIDVEEDVEEINLSDDGECGDAAIHVRDPRPPPPPPHSKFHNSGSNGGIRQRGRPRKTKDDDLESPLRRKRVKGLNNSDLQKVLLNTMLEGEEAGLEDLVSSSISELYLPLKFTFGVEKLNPEVKSAEDQESEKLWKELEFCRGACHIGSDNFCLEDQEDLEPLDSAISQQKLCARGKHYLIDDDEIGIICKFCSFVAIEIKDVTPEFNKNPFGRSENRGYGKFPYDDLISNGVQFLDPGYESLAGSSPWDETPGTVWDLIPGVKRTLYPHQQEGFEFIWRNICGGIKIEELCKPSKSGLGGCIICHAPGTGKTRLAIVFLKSYMKQFPASKPVIIAPASMLLTWEEQFAKWGPDIPFFNMNGKDLSSEELKVLGALKSGQSLDPKTIRVAKLCNWKMGKGVLGISYTLFEQLAGDREKSDHKLRQALLKQPGILVLDEGHTPRNENSLIWKVLSNVETRRRIILSGTPFQNNFQELYNTISLVRQEFVDPFLAGCCGGDYGKQRGWRSNSSYLDLMKCNLVDEHRRIKELRDKIKPFVHIHKGEILRKTLPGLFESLVVLKPSRLQQECFQRAVRPNGSSVPIGKNTLELDYLFSLISVHPSLMYKNDRFGDGEFKALLKKHKRDLDGGAKTRFLFELIKLSHNERVLVFCQFIPPLKFLAEMLKTHFSWTDTEVLYMDGKTEAKPRQTIIKDFNDDKSEARVLLASIKACSEGIHLVGASRVVLLDVVWNPSVERQAISRAYRLGQKKNVYVYHLITGAQETDKYNQQARKDRLSSLVFDSADNMSMSSGVLKDRILEEMIHHDKTKGLFEKITYQPKADNLIATFGPVN